MQLQRRLISCLIYRLCVMMHVFVICCVLFGHETKSDPFRTNSHDWLEDALRETRSNESACKNNDCADQVLKFLNEIHQDLAYANKTMSIERMSMRASNRVSDIESVLNQYETAIKDSRGTLNRSIEHLMSSLVGNMSSEASSDQHKIAMSESVSRLVDSQELEASNLESKTQAHHKVLDGIGVENLNNVMSKVSSIEKRHENSMKKLQHVRDDLRNLPIGEELCDGSCEIIEHEPGRLESSSNRSQTILNEQLQEDSLFRNSSHVNLVLARQLAILSERFIELAGNSRASKLISTRLFFQQAHKQLEGDQQLEDKLSSKLHEARASLNNSRNTLNKLIDLRRSIKSNEEREMDEQLSLIETQRDNKDISRELEKLASRLNESQRVGEQLRLKFSKSDHWDQSLVSSLKESTQKLANQNKNVQNWHKSELETTGLALAELSDQLVGSTRTSVARAQNWTGIIELGQTIQALIDDVSRLDGSIETIISRAISVEKSLNGTQKGPRWTKHSLQSMLDSIIQLRTNEMATLSNRVAQLRVQLILSSSLLERTKSNMDRVQSRMNEMSQLERKTLDSSAYANSQSDWLSSGSDIEMRHSIRGLRVKLDRAHSLVNRMKFLRRQAL